MSREFGDAFTQAFNPNFQSNYDSFLKLLLQKKLAEQRQKEVEGLWQAGTTTTQVPPPFVTLPQSPRPQSQGLTPNMPQGLTPSNTMMGVPTTESRFDLNSDNLRRELSRVSPEASEQFTKSMMFGMPKYGIETAGNTVGRTKLNTFTGEAEYTPLYSEQQKPSTERENPHQWLADSMNPNLSEQERGLAKQKYDSYVKNQGAIAGVRAEASHPFSLQDRQIDSYTGADNVERYKMQRPDGTTYEMRADEASATTDQRNRAVAMKKVDPILESISELSEKINVGKGLAAKISGGVERAKAEANLNDDVSEYNALIAGFTPLVARAVGHSGVLTEQDVQSVKEMFPKVGDSKTLRDRKIARIKFILGAVQGTGGEPQSGNIKFDVGGQEYTIPSNEVDDFLKDFPNAKRK